MAKIKVSQALLVSQTGSPVSAENKPSHCTIMIQSVTLALALRRVMIENQLDVLPNSHVKF